MESEMMTTTMTIEEADEMIKSLTSKLIAVTTERNQIRAAARRVIKCHDGNTLSLEPGDSRSIENLRELVAE